jgi:hypothetical protein
VAYNIHISITHLVGHGPPSATVLFGELFFFFIYSIRARSILEASGSKSKDLVILAEYPEVSGVVTFVPIADQEAISSDRSILDAFIECLIYLNPRHK